MKVLGKRTSTFRPTPDVKVMLAEVNSLIVALDYPLTLEEVINASLRSYLPPLIVSLKRALKQQEKQVTLRAIREAETFIREGKPPLELPASTGEPDTKSTSSGEEKAAEEEQTVKRSLLERLG